MPSDVQALLTPPEAPGKRRSRKVTHATQAVGLPTTAPVVTQRHSGLRPMAVLHPAAPHRMASQ
jgi:hypothetical protein